MPAAGYSIAPENFVVGGATPLGNNRYEGGNVDNVVEIVEFVQEVGDVNVKANVTLEATATLNANSDINIDIDESSINPVINNVSGACINMSYPLSANSNAVVTPGSGATETIAVAGVTSTLNRVVNLFKSENSLVSYLLGTLTVTASAGYTIQDASMLLDIPPELDGSYSVVVSGTSAAKTFKVFYTETPSSLSFTPCSFNNVASISYTVLADQVTSTGGVHGVITDSDIGFTDKEVIVKVFGDPGASYTLAIKKEHTSAADGNYDFGTKTFVTSSTTDKTATIPASGSSKHPILIPQLGSGTNEYSVIVGSSGGSVLASGVPTAVGDHKITQHGQGSLSLRPATWWSTEFGSMPAALVIKRPVRFKGDAYITKKPRTAITNGTTNGNSKTVKIDKYNKSIKSGMYAIGSNIPSGTVINKISGNIMQLSASVSLPSFTKITAKENNPNVMPFSFTITPGSGRTLAVNASNKHVDSIWGLRDVSHKSIAQTQIANYSSSAPYVGQNFAMDSISGVVVGMVVTVPDLPNIFTDECVVNHIVPSKPSLNGAETYTLYVSRMFTTALPSSSMINFTGKTNPKCRVTEVTAVQNGANVVIDGFVEAPEISSGTALEVRVDEIINVT